jgi:regulator of cell morphogenesis and NO signaling
MSDPDNTSLSLIEKNFTSFKETLLNRIKNDEKEWFPYCLSLSSQQSGKIFTLKKNPSGEPEEPIETLLTGLRHIMIKHMTGEYDANLCHAVIFSVSILAKDIKQHNRIRFRILQPIVAGMEKAGK